MNAVRIAHIEAGLLIPKHRNRPPGWDASRLNAAGYPIAAAARVARESAFIRMEMNSPYGKVAL